jgi:pimeloyl-ACP methyl ester carboxylesterase
VATAAAFVRERNGVSRINLIGWSWGTSLMARYTAEHNEAVVKLVLIAPQWTRDPPSLADNSGTLGACRTVKRTDAKARWLNGVPAERQTAVLPEAWFDVWADAIFGPGENQIKAPNGTVQDSREFWATGCALYDPSLIRVPVLIVHADGDRDCPLELSRAVFSKLTNATCRLWVEIGEGTHSVFMERNRWQVKGAVQGFLDEVAPY